MSLHYRPIVLACCSGSYLVEKASKVAWVEEDEWVMVEMEAEAVKQEVGWIEASNFVMGYSIEDAKNNMAEMIECLDREDTEVHKTKEKVWTMKGE